jgi:hypothetical protein
MDNCENIGYLTIDCVIGNTIKPIPLKFEDESDDPIPVITPIDLTQYPVIKADITDMLDRFIDSVSLGDGIAVSGANNEWLTITFSQDMTAKLQKYKNVKFDLLLQTGAGVNWYTIKAVVNLIRTNTREDVS